MKFNKLHFLDVKENFKTYLKNIDNNKYKDYNFEGSGISQVLNVLAYNIHYIGYYCYSVFNEMFLDSAQKRDNILSHAKKLGYIPRGRKSSRLDVIVTYQTNDMPIGGVKEWRKEWEVLGNTPLVELDNKSGSNEGIFHSRGNVTLTNYVTTIDSNGNKLHTFTSEPISIFEGKRREWKFQVDASIKHQKFVINDNTVDSDTIEVYIADNEEGKNKTRYYIASSYFDIDGDSQVFYLTATRGGNFEIMFGNNVYGKAPEGSSYIFVNYQSTKGESTNGLTNFKLNASTNYSNNIDQLGWNIEMIAPSDEGSNYEEIESIRFNAPNHYTRQNRILTYSDYKHILVREFSNVRSVNVWGGETDTQKSYGSVFICVKPNYADKLSNTSKADIRRKLNDDYSIVDIKFKDPIYININIQLLFTPTELGFVDMNTTKAGCISSIKDYNTQTLNTFENSYYNVKLTSKVLSDNSNLIKSCFTKIECSMTDRMDVSDVNSRQIKYLNEILPRSISCILEIDTEVLRYFDDGDGVLWCDRQGVDLEEVGTVDYKRGIISYKLHSNVFIVKDLILEPVWKFIPAEPDIVLKENNIARIVSIEAKLND